MARIPAPSDDCKGDMTPMIDVVFLLIVFFLCIEFKVLESKVDAFLPTDAGSSHDFVLPEEQLVVQVHVAAPGTVVVPSGAHATAAATGRPPRYRLEGHRVRYVVGPVPCTDSDTCSRELRRFAQSPSIWIPDRDGNRKQMKCVVEGYPDTRYADIAQAADMCRAAGFTEISFGGGVR